MVSTVEIFNVTIPPKDGLCCMICKIMNSEDNPLIYSNYCRNKLKCGQFLRETPQAMAAPITNRKLLELGNSLYVIVTKDFWESHIFRKHCDALNIQMTDLLHPLPNDVYETCLHYTVEHRLAPRWNKVGSYLVGGQDFLSSKKNVAIELKIRNILDNIAEFHVKAVNLTIPFLRLNPYQRAITIYTSVYVLPSMQKGNVLSKSKAIKEKYLFKDYENLREYWKNMHGYILPDNEEGLLYYEIEFDYFDGFDWCSSVRLYPETCLTSRHLDIFLSTDPVFTINTFEEDLGERMRELCGQQLNVIRMENKRFFFLQRDLAGTSMLPSRVDISSTCDTGYDTQSSSFTNNEMPSLKFASSNIILRIPSQLSPPGINNSLTCKTDYVTDNIATISCEADSTTMSKPIVQINEEKSLKRKISKPENKALVQVNIHANL
ncbi:hypothetical protein ALC57_04983 [Trachymyrmex cornetzi]|uniref:DUF4708 domain-containing protein n=1 Tax=Trachymyrmex cornetzi TaxID=471704 RepID=A0A151JC69_9HYME|nr:hypothetical protein ALC57_04983 [Trachymyrmex cornetzi]